MSPPPPQLSVGLRQPLEARMGLQQALGLWGSHRQRRAGRGLARVPRVPAPSPECRGLCFPICRLGPGCPHPRVSRKSGRSGLTEALVPRPKRGSLGAPGACALVPPCPWLPVRVPGVNVSEGDVLLVLGAGCWEGSWQVATRWAERFDLHLEAALPGSGFLPRGCCSPALTSQRFTGSEPPPPPHRPAPLWTLSC